MLSQVGEAKLSRALFPTWWGRNQQHVYGGGGIIIGVIFGIPAILSINNTSNGGAGNAIQNNKSAIVSNQEQDSVEPFVEPPPTDFPSPEIAQVKALTDDERANVSFADTKVMIRNDSSKKLKLAFSYRPYQYRNLSIAASEYVHRVSQDIPSGFTLEQREVNFGGAVHVSIFSDQKWITTNEWHDLKVVPRRTLVITEKSGIFSCRVEFEEDTQ